MFYPLHNVERKPRRRGEGRSSSGKHQHNAAREGYIRSKSTHFKPRPTRERLELRYPEESMTHSSISPQTPAALVPHSTVPHLKVAIIGSGFAGLGAAIRLERAGISDYLVLERAGEVGGTWRDNTYPGCACDVPSHLYSFSFAPNPHWSRMYAPQAEILEYLRRTARRFAVLPKIAFDTEVLSATWVELEEVWQLETSSGPFTAQYLISGHGPLVTPKWPDLPGLDTFEGVKFHSARWNHQVSLEGKRVAVIGTGASAIQFVPAIANQVSQMYVFQRSAPWVVPRPDRAFSDAEKEKFESRPLTQLASRAGIFLTNELNYLGFTNPRMEKVAMKVARDHLEKQVQDPDLREKLTPNYRMGCKRILVSSSFYPALLQPNVELVTEKIVEVRPEGVVTEDGVLREVDVLICGTGYVATPPPIARIFTGVGGRSLAEVWGRSPKAYLGTTVSGFPNLFLLVGPNTALGHNSIVYMIEAQLNYVLGCFDYMRRSGRNTFEVRLEAQKAYNAEIQAALERSVWVRGGCTSFYLDSTGTNSTLWPGFALQFKRRLARFDPAAYTFSGTFSAGPLERGANLSARGSSPNSSTRTSPTGALEGHRP